MFIRGYRYVAYDLDCNQTIADLSAVPIRSFKAQYRQGSMTFDEVNLPWVQHYNELLPWGTPKN